MFIDITIDAFRSSQNFFFQGFYGVKKNLRFIGYSPTLLLSKYLYKYTLEFLRASADFYEIDLYKPTEGSYSEFYLVCPHL